MLKKYLVLAVTVFSLAGCVSEEPMPQVVYDGSTITPKPLPPPVKPVTPKPSIVTPPSTASGPSAWMPSRPDRAWSAIVIHHSATREGNSAIFDKWHREENGWEGVGYDFVIGNGTNSGDGEIEPTYRWRGQLTGAHVGGTAGNWANEEGIGICLVGDFNKTIPTARQMDSLVKLTRFLERRYGISKSRVYGHGTTPGAHKTDCPGTRFPMSWLKANLPN